ncbi:ATP-binding protein [Aestuariibacter halophilus]|uniref:ATP-binding protein n=1 Tax=Fluctibacter halophilus TaxID=226011 RepID=A0ABS8GC96_9ALTE|nr:ATP-binding protein [Aestuariibacter halophilus]MCC2618133.1 ATP-binding protein [Aestuariibacter halophilus]
MPGLHRIILIDTHLPGVVELKLNGHTNICGTNASGKTTLQRLIPVFYGEYPSRVVPATRDSFEKWYLPRESSFIIYEFARNEDDLCQVVLASSGNGVNYRFIGKPFEIEDYLYPKKDGSHASVTMNELARALKRNNVLVTNLLNTKEYRAVLQNDRMVLNSSANSRELLGYARIFSLCDQKHHLRHIEKLAKAVHSKEGKMETIKAMIAAILEEDGVQPPSSNLSRNRVEDWIRECHLIKEFDAIRPEFAKLEQADHELTVSDQRLAQLKQQFSFDISHLSASITEHERVLDDVIMASKQHEQQWSELRDSLNQQLSSARADSEKFEKDLDQVEQEFERWQAQDIDTLQANVQRLPQWQSELDMASTRYSLLTEKHQDIESAYNKRLAEIADKVAAEMDGLGEQKQALQDKRAEQQAESQSKLQDIKDEHQQQREGLEGEFRQQLNDLKIEQAQVNAAIKNAGYSEFEQSQLDLLDASIKEASTAEDAARDNLRKVQQGYQQAVQQRDRATSELEKARRAYQQQQQVVSDVEALLYPGEGSLLEFLRKEIPGWESRLGKVIRPELLNRVDLKPAAADGNDALLGVSLHLDNLDTPAYAADEKALQTRLHEAQQILAERLEAQNDAELALAQASEGVRNQELVQAKAESEVRTAEANRKRAQQDKDQVQREYAQALSERKQQNKKRLAENERQQDKLQAQHSEALQELQDQLREAQTEHQFHWQQLIGDTEEQLQQVDSHIRKVKDNAAADRKQTEQWLANELDNRGVDVDEIGELQKQIKQLKQDIQYTDSNRNKVKDYERWYETVFTGHKVTWQQGLAKARKAATHAERELQKQDAQYKQQRDSHKAQQSETEQALKQAKEQQVDVQNIQRAVAKLTLPEAEMAAERGADTVNIAQRISEGQALLQQRERLLGDVKAYVEHFDQLIAAQAGTGLSDTWERARDECAVISEQGIRGIDHRRMVSHLAQLLNVIVPQKLNGLREQGRIFGADLTQYYHVLEDIDKRIAGQSRRISQEVEEELFLEGVSDSAVKIRSRISELEFWPELAAFNQHYKTWMDSGAVELPDDEYGQSMRRVLDILGRAALSGGISRLLDIELHIKEGASNLVIRTDRQLNESSSHGMAYLILCKFLLAFTRLLRGEADATVHWPIDELGTLHQSNIKKIFDACQNNNISVVGAFPNPESEVLTLFDNRYLIDKTTRKLQVVQPKVSAIKARLQQRQEQANEEVSI